MGDNTEMGTLAVTAELHAKQQEAARKEAERAARKAPRDAAADERAKPGNQRPKRVRPPGEKLKDLHDRVHRGSYRARPANKAL